MGSPILTPHPCPPPSVHSPAATPRIPMTAPNMPFSYRNPQWPQTTEQGTPENTLIQPLSIHNSPLHIFHSSQVRPGILAVPTLLHSRNLDTSPCLSLSSPHHSSSHYPPFSSSSTSRSTLVSPGNSPTQCAIPWLSLCEPYPTCIFNTASIQECWVTTALQGY